MHTLKILVTELPRTMRAHAQTARRKMAPGAAGTFWMGYFIGVLLLAWVIG